MFRRRLLPRRARRVLVLGALAAAAMAFRNRRIAANERTLGTR